MVSFSRRSILVGASSMLMCTRRRLSENAVIIGDQFRHPEEENMEVDAGPFAEGKLLEWSFPNSPIGTGHAAILIPRTTRSNRRWPVVVALHGHGEALKPPAEGMLGWPRDYALERAIDRVSNPPLTRADFEGYVDAPHLDEINRSLRTKSYGGLIVVCPYMPDLDSCSAKDLRTYSLYITEWVLPRVRKETPALGGAEATGIDGVSQGGAMALRLGLTRPDEFGAVGALQPALQESQEGEMCDLVRAAKARRPELQLRLTTSHDDYFKKAITRISGAWKKAGIDHDFADLPGPHDYSFNRGPGALELLLWHDRVLARTS
jgi:pimeloyl-ACP methyl ester carboxylesterase